MEYGKRHPVSIKKERQMALGIAIAGGGLMLAFFTPVLYSVFNIHFSILGVRLTNIIFDLILLTGIIITARGASSIPLKTLILIAGILTVLLSLVRNLLIY
jgi:hypothetical protein